MYEKTFIYPVEAVLVPVLQTSFSRSSLRRYNKFCANSEAVLLTCLEAFWCFLARDSGGVFKNSVRRISGSWPQIEGSTFWWHYQRVCEWALIPPSPQHCLKAIESASSLTSLPCPSSYSYKFSVYRFVFVASFLPLLCIHFSYFFFNQNALPHN